MITSKNNARVQTIRSLLNHRKDRDRTNLYVIEGVRLLEEAVAGQAQVEEVFFTRTLSERGQVLVEKFRQLDIPVEEMDESIFNQLMDTSTSQGISAICRKEMSHLPDFIHFGIIADQLRDPGNLGTLLRIAAAAGAQLVMTTRGSVDLYSPKVLRSAMGAHFHIICLEMDWDEISSLRDACPVRPVSYVATADADLKLWNCDFIKPTLLIIGNEADGATAEGFQFADERVSIPMPGQFESLNAAVAAGILMFEVVRQRNKSTE